LASSITTYLYVNGKYVMHDDSDAFTEAAAFTRFAIKKPKNTGAFDEGCAITYKMTACSYNAGSDRAAALAGVLESGAPLYTTDSYAVVYNSDYVTPDAATNYVKVNGTPYTLVGKAIDEISKLEGDNNKITVSGRNLSVTLPDTVKKIEVTLENGAKFDAGESFVKEATEEENVYIYNRVVTMPTGDYTNAPYKWAASLTGNTNAEPHFRTASYDAKKNLKLFDYVVYDFEMTVTEGLSLPSGLIFKSNATTSTPNSGNKGLGNFAVVAKDSNYYMYKASEASKLSNDSSVFDKLTFVYEMGKDADGNLASVTLYLFVNGNYVAQTTTALSGDYGLARFQIQDSDGWSSGGVTFKNINIHSYYSDGVTISGTSTDLDGQTADGKKAAALEEYLKSIASITVGEESYINLTEAGAALNLLEDGSTITLNNMNVANFNTTLKSFNVIAANGTETFTLDADCAWRYANIGDKYTKVISDGMKANLSLFSDKHQFRIYIPMPEVGTLEGVKFYTGATNNSEDKNPKFATHTDKEGNTYLVLLWNSRMDMNGKTAYAEIKYIDENKVETTLMARFTATFDIPGYLTKVADTYGCGTEEAVLAKAITDFRYEFLKICKAEIKLEDYADATDPQKAYDADVAKVQGYLDEYANFYAIYAAHTNCKCGSVAQAIDPEDTYINVGTKQETLVMPEGVSVTYGAGSQLFYMYVYSKAGDTVTVTDKNGKTVATAEIADGKAVIVNIAAYQIDDQFTITITTSGAEGEEPTEVCSFTYSLADYNIESNADVANLVKALKNYAIAAENYKKDPAPTSTTPEA